MNVFKFEPIYMKRIWGGQQFQELFNHDLDSNEKVIHLFGKPDQSRNFVLSNKEAVISPAWSIHTGAGTTNYKFVWSTAGENITYSDFNLVETKNLK